LGFFLTPGTLSQIFFSSFMAEEVVNLSNASGTKEKCAVTKNRKKEKK
jgi:hypothetical protein